MNKLKIHVSRKKLEEFCRRNHIRNLAFFGSVLRDDFGPESDVDALVEFKPGKTRQIDNNIGMSPGRNFDEPGANLPGGGFCVKWTTSRKEKQPFVS